MIRVNGCGEEEDLEKIPGAAVERLSFAAELGRWIEVVLVNGLSDGYGDTKASLTGEIGYVNENTIRESLPSAVAEDYVVGH